MANSLGNISGRVSLDTVDFTQNLAALKRELRTAKSDLKLAEQGFDTFGNAVDKNEGQMKVLERSMKATRQELDRYEQDYKEATAALKENTDETGKVSRAQQQAQANYSKTLNSLKDLEKQYEALAKAQRQQNSTFYQTSDWLDKTGGKVRKVGQQLSGFADTWTGVGVAVGGATALVIKQYTDWESSVASMSKTIDNTDGTVDRLATSFRKLSTEIPVSSTELNELAGVAGQLGIESQNIEQFVRVVADLGVATNVSAEEAAMSLAQLANITNMNQDNFDRLGSTIVHLGNNFATTEKDIINMAQRLAGAGSQIGMTEAEIFAVATSLSSLGIAAEQGGSSFSKLMINMAVAAEAGGEDLEAFAKVAGMSSSEFAKAFGEDAVGAIALFVDGLGNASEHGESTIGILDEMGISEVRLRDTLLRLGGAQGLFNEALGVANEGWDENNALTNEANERYETNASKIKMAKNEIQDYAITIGAELLPAIADLLGEAEPLVDVVTDSIEAFANSSDEAKRFAAQLIGITVVGGPVLKVFATLLQGLGGIGQGLGKAGKALFDYNDKAKVAGKATEGLAKTTTGGGKAIVGALKGISPQMIVVTGLVAAGVAAWKLWGEEAYNSSERADKWGTDIGEANDKALTSFQELASEVQLSTATMKHSVEDGAQGAISAFEQMGNEIVETAQGNIEEATTVYGELPESVQRIMGEANENYIAGQENLVGEVARIQGEITGVYENAVANNRELTEAELSIISEYQNQLLDLRNETLELTAEESRRIHAVMAKDLESFSQDQLSQRRKLIDEEKDLLSGQYEEQRALIESEHASGYLKEAEYHEALRMLDAEYSGYKLELATEEAKVLNQQMEEYGGITEVQLQQIADKYGVTARDVRSHMKRISESQDETGESLQQLEENIRLATESWNLFILDPKTGEVRTNLPEFIQEASESDETWNDLQFMIHHAEMDTNAQQMIYDALIANGQWWDLQFQPKWADINTNAVEEAESFLKAEGVWDGLSFEQQEAILKSNTRDEVVQALKDWGIWETLEFKDQQAYLGSNTVEEVSKAEEKNYVWNGMEFEAKEAKVDVTNNAEATRTELHGTTEAAQILGGMKPNVSVMDNSHITKGRLDGTTEAASILDRQAPYIPTETNALFTKGEFDQATYSAEILNGKNPYVTTSTDARGNVTTKLDEASFYADVLDGKNPYVTAGTNSPTVQSQIESALRSARNKSFTVKGVVNWVSNVAGGIAKFFGHAKGTEVQPTGVHPGGLATVNDEKSSTFRELVTLPNGTSFIPQGRDVTLPLPKGSKVLRASKTKLKFPDLPQYAQGTRDEEISPFIVPRGMFNSNQNNSGSMSRDGANQQGNSDVYNVYITANGELPASTIRRMADQFEQEIKKNQDRKRMARGEGVSFN